MLENLGLLGGLLSLWVAITVLMAALGVGICSCIFRLEASWENAYWATWAAFALLSVFLLLCHFFLPIDSTVAYGLSLLAVGAAIWRRHWWLSLLARKLPLGFAGLACLLVVWVANHSLGAAAMDDYNYEFQAVRWYGEFPLVPGLAHLHGRMGFNNSHHLVAALFSSVFWHGWSNQVVNGWVVSLCLVGLCWQLANFAKGIRHASTLMGPLLLQPAFGLVLFGVYGPLISTLKADVLVTAVSFTLAVLYLRSQENGLTPEEKQFSQFVLLIVSWQMVTVKLSAAVFSLLLNLPICLRSWRERGVALGLSISALFVLLFGLRGVFLSGYPFYPLTLLPAPVDWRVSAAQADADRIFIKTWSQLRPTYDLAEAAQGGWLHNWAKSTVLTDKYSIVLPLSLIFFLGILYLLSTASARKNAQEADTRGLRWLAFSSLGAVCVWFWQAPAGRFGFAYFWIAAACLLTIYAQRSRLYSLPKLFIVGLICVLGLGSGLVHFLDVAAAYRAGLFVLLGGALAWVALWTRFYSYPGASLVLLFCLALWQIGDRGATHLAGRRWEAARALAWIPIEPPTPRSAAKIIPRTTKSGLTVYELEEPGFQSPLPNTRYFNPDLELRRKDDMRSGFRVNGEAHPERMGYGVIMVPQPDGEAKEKVLSRPEMDPQR